MEEDPPQDGANAPTSPTAVRPTLSGSNSSPGVTRKRSTSGASGLLSRLPFMRSSTDHHRPRSRSSTEEVPEPDTLTSNETSPGSHAGGTLSSMASALQQQQPKTRRRRGSLRKVALLGRGAQRARRESHSLSIDTKQGTAQTGMGGNEDADGFVTSPSSLDDDNRIPLASTTKTTPIDGYGLGIVDITPRPSMDGFASRTKSTSSTDTVRPTPQRTTASNILTPTLIPPEVAEPALVLNTNRPVSIEAEPTLTSPTINYSTTDDEDTLHMGVDVRSGTPPSLLRQERSSMSSGSDSYFAGGPLPGGSSSSSSHILPSLHRRRSTTTQRAKSPLALTSLMSTTPLPQAEGDWDYAETEWWGWVVLVVTWTVFVIGMGSCLGVWSWAWDVGTTPYAPPELEDDPTLPIVGYYPALIILTSVMAWVWVVISWVGMKYFRHARVSGD